VRKVERCPLCGGTRFGPYGACTRTERTTLHFAQVRCRQCHLLISQPQASSEEMECYYREVYYQTVWTDPDAIWAENGAAYRTCELPLLQRLWADWPPPAGAKAAEIGCGYGAFLGVLSEEGWRVQGCDPSPRSVEECRKRGLDVQVGMVPGAPFEAASFDLAASLHVIEHLADPQALANELVSLVRPGGLVVVITDSRWYSQAGWSRLQARLRGKTPPFHTSTDHTFVFGAKHLRQMLTKAGCDAVHVGAFHRQPPRESLHWRLFKGTFRTLDRWLGQGEYLAAVGRRG